MYTTSDLNTIMDDIILWMNNYLCHEQMQVFKPARLLKSLVEIQYTDLGLCKSVVS